MTSLVRLLFRAWGANVSPVWTGRNLHISPPATGCHDGSLHRQDRLAGAGVGYFEKDGYYTKDDGAHREASAWTGRGAEALGLSGPIDLEAFRRVALPRTPC